MSLAGAALGLLHRPAEAMKEFVSRPKSWIWAALFVAVCLAVMLLVTAPYQLALTNERSAEMIERLTANMSEAQAEAVRASSKPTTLTQYAVIGGLAALALSVVGWLVRAAIVHFSSTAMGGQSTWGATFAMTVWSMVPYAVSNLVLTVYTLINGTVVQHTGLGGFFSSGNWLEDSRSLTYNLVSGLDPFALWHLILFAIGISVAIKVSRVKGAVLAVVLFALFMGLKLIPVLINSAFMGNL